MMSSQKNLIDTLIMADGVHLTDEGNQGSSRYIAPMIADMINPGKQGR
jgi:hypothetical protein